MKTALILIAALLAQPFAAQAKVVDPYLEMSSKTPSELAADIRSMSPEERRDAIEAYRAYLSNLDSALKQAQAYTVTHNGRSVEVTVSKVGFGFVVAGGLMLVPSLYMTKSEFVLAAFFGGLGLRVAAGTAGIGALLLTGAGISAGTKLALNAYQVRTLRKSIAHIGQQLVEIEALTAK
jgi:ribosomal protein L29